MAQGVSTSSGQPQPSPETGWIFDIQHFSVHDGPGIRTTIFFKGCPLSCLWCSNPESQNPKPQLMYFSQLCKGCASCVEACSHKAVKIENAALKYVRDQCVSCGTCASACLYEARTLSGRQMTVQQLCDAVSEDWRFYMQTGGGVTCGGGEPLMQPGFLRSLLIRLHDELGYHTSLDTSGFAPWNVLESLLAHLDLVLLDIKHMDSSVHKKLTGVGNELILHNAQELARRGFPVLTRVPLIPGANDDRLNLNALGQFLSKNNLRDVEVIPYHTYGLNKYKALGIDYAFAQTAKPDCDFCKSILGSYQLKVEIRQ